MDELEVGPGLYVMMVPVDKLREQDVNAQVMSPRHMERLTENIRMRGQIESLPYCSWPEREGPIEIVSGHHRVRAARSAGLPEIPCLVDILPMRRSEIIAKQIAHNEIHGSPDEQILRQMVDMIDNVDDLLTTGLPEDWVPSVGKDDTTLGLPSAHFEWHAVTLLFLSRQLTDLKKVFDDVDGNAELVGVARDDQYETFARKVIDFGRAYNVRSVAAAIGVLSKMASQALAARRLDVDLDRVVAYIEAEDCACSGDVICTRCEALGQVRGKKPAKK